ncbi:MAG: hypothetical protein OXI87_22565 [Albidovulum sp.]|nr:hypothetical protein [Albidovulum sp.]MDE0307640.1 hypothetical protein [Albidovulum sp.]MDE0530862.1 hypothetical protein [Albidovulum sp.]
MNQKNNQRASVVLVFPNNRNCSRFLCAQQIKMYEDWLEANRYMSMIICRARGQLRTGRAA